MSAPFGPLVVTLSDMTKRMRSTFEGFTDPQTGKNTTKTIVDAALSAFTVFFLRAKPLVFWNTRVAWNRRGEKTTPGRCSGLTTSPRTTRSDAAPDTFPR